MCVCVSKKLYGKCRAQYLCITILKTPEIPLLSSQMEIPLYQRFCLLAFFNEAGAADSWRV